MIQTRKAEERGRTKIDWLDSYHSFSFGDYFDPQHQAFRTLRVMNEDLVVAGGGFAPHSHRDMEILTFVLEGELEHKDSMGNGSVIRSGEVQRMTAGTGVTHSEFNHSSRESVHLLQIWIYPEKKGLKPGYEQKRIEPEKNRNRLCLAAARKPFGNAVLIHQDVNLYLAILERNKPLHYSIPLGRYAWIQLAKGKLEFNGISLKEGDGAAVSEETDLNFLSKSPRSEFLLFDLV